MNSANLIKLAIATVLFSLVGVLVKLVNLPPASIALARAFVATITLLGFFIVRRQPLLVLRRRSDLLPLCILGILMSSNWYFFFVSIKVSTVAVAIVSLFTYPFMTTLLEPLLLKTRYNFVDCVGAMAVVAGVVLIVPRFQISDTTTRGVLFGLLSAVSFSLCNILNKKLLDRYLPGEMMIYQFIVATLLFLPACPAFLSPVPLVQYLYLIVLGAVLTALSLFLFINSFKYLAASTSSIFISLQPFLTVLLAIIFLKEIPTARTMAGGAIICITVVVVSLVHVARRPGIQ